MGHPFETPDCNCEFPCSCVKFEGYVFPDMRKLAEHLVDERDRYLSDLWSAESQLSDALYDLEYT